MEGEASFKNSTISGTCSWFGFRTVFEFLISDWLKNRSLIALIRKPFQDSGRIGLREVESGTVPRTPTNTKPNISRDKFASLAARYSDDSEDIGGDRGKKL